MFTGIASVHMGTSFIPGTRGRRAVGVTILQARGGWKRAASDVRPGPSPHRCPARPCGQTLRAHARSRLLAF